MAENTRLKDLQAEIKGQVDALKRMMDLLELRDCEQRAHMQSVQAEAQNHMDKIQKSLDLLLNSPVQSHSHGGSASNSSFCGAIPLSIALMVKDISLGFPHFDGHSSVLEWIFKAEKFFNYHRTPDADRVEIATMHFEKEVVPWFQVLQRMSAIHSWTELTKALESQFGPSPFDCPMADLFKLQQTVTVSDYYLKFMSLANRSSGLQDDALLNCFWSGLHTEIRRDVVAQAPTSLLRVVALAKLYEERYFPVSKTSSIPVRCYSPISSSSLSVNQNQNKSNAKNALPLLLPTPNVQPLKNVNVKKMSPAEMQIRREKGLCYFCDDNSLLIIVVLIGNTCSCNWMRH